MDKPLIPGVTFRGYDPHTGKPAAAIVFAPVDPATKDRILAALPSGVKHNVLLAKRWKVWAVYASETWAFEHRDEPAPQKPLISVSSVSSVV